MSEETKFPCSRYQLFSALIGPFSALKMEIRNINDPKKRTDVGHMYLFTVGWRCVNSSAMGIISCPLRRKAWILKCDAFDIRSAQDTGALAHREGNGGRLAKKIPRKNSALSNRQISRHKKPPNISTWEFAFLGAWRI